MTIYASFRRYALQFVAWQITRRRGITGKPFDLCVGGLATPHFYRWELYRCRFFKIYLHNFVGDDNDPILHDHRYANISIPLIGGYIEEQFMVPRKPGAPLPRTHRIERKQWRIYCRLPSTAHRIEMLRGPHGNPLRCWSLFICGPEWRNWGFHCPQGWRPWEQYVVGDYGSRGLSQKGGGCGE